MAPVNVHQDGPGRCVDSRHAKMIAQAMANVSTMMMMPVNTVNATKVLLVTIAVKM
jgi:hypothetical protein